MFRKSQRRIVVTIMSVLTGLFLGTLAVIYAASYFEVANTNFDMLERYASMYDLSDHIRPEKRELLSPGMTEPPGKDYGGRPLEPAFRLSTFYSVALDAQGKALAADIGNRDVYDEQTLTQYAADIAGGGKTKGIRGSLVYLVTAKSGYTLVSFMDNTVIKDSMSTLFRYTFLFGSIALVFLFFLSRHLARRIVEPLEKSYRRQKQFISDAGHELKTPVSVVAANADVLQRELGENRWLSNIRHENERMGRLVGQLLELARTEDVRLSKERLDFSRLVAGSVLPFESMAYEKGLRINTQLDEGVMLEGNAMQLGQLVSILLDNAIRHGRGEEDLFVQLSHGRGAAVLSVINAGEEIPPEKLAQLFERFYRTDEARSSRDGHYGLGLAIAKAIVEAHRGKIEVFCRQGRIEFRVTLPKA